MTIKNDFYSLRNAVVLNKTNLAKIASPSDFSAATTDSNTDGYLFCLPFDQAHFYLALRIFLPFIKSHRDQMSIVIHQSLYHLVRELDPQILYPLITTELDSDGLPLNATILDLIKQPHRVAVDFNPVAYTAPVFIVSQCRARFRVGFQSPYAEQLFNLVIKAREGEALELAYERIKQLITVQIT